MANINLQPPTHLKWRLIKFDLGNNRWKSFRVRDKNQLDKLVKLFNPINIYYSCSCYFNPTRVEHGTYKVDKQILWTDDIYDIDDSNGNLNNAWETTKKIMDKLGKPEQIHFTGAKGYRLIYPPKQGFTGHVKERFINDMCIRYKELDIPVSIDKTRVIRMIGSINSKTGLKCEEIQSPERYTVPMTQPYDRNNSLVQCDGVCRTGVRHTISYYIAMSNKITDDMFVPYIYTDKKPTDESLSTLQKTYNLPTIYIFKTKDTYVSLCCKIMSKKRCIKVMKAAKGRSLNRFIRFDKGKFSQLWLRTSSELNTTFPPPKLIKFVVNEINHLQSWQHYDFIKQHMYIKKQEIQIKPKDNLCHVFRRETTNDN